MRLSPYIAYAKKSFFSHGVYRFENFMSILSTCVQIFIFWFIYKALYGGSSDVNGITMPMVTTNFVISMGLGAALSPDDFFLPNKILDGSISMEFLRPTSFKGRMIAENAGSALFNIIFRFIPALLVAVLTIGINAPATLMMFLIFLLSALLGYGVLWTISFALQMSSFWLTDIWSFVTIKNVFVNVFSGTMIPLWFMPEGFGEVMRFLPFSSIYFTPVQIYLGQLSYGEIVEKCAIQLLWIVLFFGIGDVLWKKGQKKLAVNGG